MKTIILICLLSATLTLSILAPALASIQDNASLYQIPKRHINL